MGADERVGIESGSEDGGKNTRRGLKGPIVIAAEYKAVLVPDRGRNSATS